MMLLEKLILIQSVYDVSSIEYQISKKALFLNKKILNFSLKEFIEELGVSKSTFSRFLKKLEIQKYSYFQDILYIETIQTMQNIQEMKEKDNHYHIKDSNKLYKKIKEARKTLILGANSHQFALLEYIKLLIFLDIDIELPVYYTSEDILLQQYQLDQNDLIIQIGLTEKASDYMDLRITYYVQPQYYKLHTSAYIFYIGKTGLFKSEYIDDEITISSHNSISDQLNVLTRLFENVIYLMLKEHSLVLT